MVARLIQQEQPSPGFQLFRSIFHGVDQLGLPVPCRPLPWRSSLSHHIASHQYDADDLADGSVPKTLASPELPRTLSDDEDIPCPRRFGATFAANGSLIVFSSSIEVVRAGRKRVEGDGDGQVQ